MNVASTNVNYKLWHERLGHIHKNNFIKLKEMIEDDYSLKNVNPDNELCEPCIFGKQLRLPFAKSKNKKKSNNRPLFIVHTDVCSQITPSTVNEKNYFVCFIDDYTHYTVTYLVFSSKSEVFAMFKDYVLKAENYLNTNVVNLYCDNGIEYLSNDFKEFMAQKG